jgi:protein SCO1/2
MNEVIPRRKRAAEAGRRWSRPCLTAMIGLALILGLPAVGRAHGAREGGRLPAIGPAPEFTLTTHEGRPLALRELRGKVVVVTFIYASCADTCPILTAKLAGIQRRLGPALGSVFFAGVTVDPERDTPEVLRRYAEVHGVNPAGWTFVTGTPPEIRAVARQYGVYHRKQSGGDVDHTFLTSLVDRRGVLRVQYLGVRFDPDEFLADLRRLLGESARR